MRGVAGVDSTGTIERIVGGWNVTLDGIGRIVISESDLPWSTDEHPAAKEIMDRIVGLARFRLLNAQAIRAS